MLVNSSERNPQLNLFSFHPESCKGMAGHTKMDRDQTIKDSTTGSNSIINKIWTPAEILRENLPNLVPKLPVFSKVWGKQPQTLGWCSWWKLHAAIPIQHGPVLWIIMHNLIPALYLLLKNMGDNLSAKLPDIKDTKCRKDAKKSGTRCVHGSNVASFCRLPPDTSLFTFWAHSILQELPLFADDRVPQQPKNVKHKQHVPVRTMQKVSLGCLSQSGSFPFMPLPCYALCLQITQQFPEPISGVLLLWTWKCSRGREEIKGINTSTEMKWFCFTSNFTMQLNIQGLSYIIGKNLSFRSVEKQDCSSLA